MGVTGIQKDPEGRTMVITAEYAAPPERVWRLWADPRLLERWWGPPTHPATVTDHDLVPGGRVTYHMTGPEGDRYHGWWIVRSVDAPSVLEFQDGFADEAGSPNPDLPTTVTRVTLAGLPGGGIRMDITSTFTSVEAMRQMLDMGVEQGISAALGQTDALVEARVS